MKLPFSYYVVPSYSKIMLYITRKIDSVDDVYEFSDSFVV